MTWLGEMIKVLWLRTKYWTKLIVVVGLVGGAWQGEAAFWAAILMSIALIAIDVGELS